MLTGVWRQIGVAFRYGLAVVAALIVVWSFALVLSRPFRSERGGRLELKVLHWGDREEDAITASLVESFEAAHPDIRIKRINGGANYYAKLKTMCAAGEPPDVIFLNARDVSTYAGLGLLKDVGAFMAADEAAGAAAFRAADFYAPALDSFRFDGVSSGRGTLYGLPSNFTGLGFYYNRTLFDKAKVAYPTDDWTWEEFEEKTRLIGERLGGQGVDGCALELTGDSMRAILKTFGVELFSDDFKSVRVEDPALTAVLNRIRGWTVENKGNHAVFATDPYDNVNRGDGFFTLQRAAVYGPTGRWQVPLFRGVKDFEWDFVPMPRGTQQGTILYVAAWCVAEGTEHPKESWMLARHLALPEGQAQLARLGLAIPSLKSVATSEAFLDPRAEPRRDDLFLKGIESAWPAMWPPDSRFPRRFSDHLQDCLRLGRRTVAQSMAAARADWEEEQGSALRTGTFERAPWGRIAWGVGAGVAGLVAVTAWRLWRGRPGKLRRAEERAGYAMVSPWVIGFALFVAGPMVVSFLLAFTRWAGLTTIDHAEWVGLLNFEQAFRHDARFAKSLGLTVRYAVLAVPMVQIAALGAALLLSQKAPGTKMFRAVWYLPSVLAGAGMAVMWRWVLNGDGGMLNAALRPLSGVVQPVIDFAARLGLTERWTFPPDWLGADAEWAGVPAFAIASLWGIGGSMLIYLAGLHAVPPSLYEAAEIDGAGPARRFWNVTLPMLSPVILFNVVIGLIASFQVFTQAYVMTEGGPGDSTRFYVLYLYNNAFEYHRMGYASAMAWVLFVIVLVLTGIVMWVGKKRVHYEGGRV